MPGSSPEPNSRQWIARRQPSIEDEGEERRDSVMSTNLGMKPPEEPPPEDDSHSKTLRQQEDSLRQHISSVNLQGPQLQSPQPKRSVRFQHVAPPSSMYPAYPEQEQTYAFPNQFYPPAPPMGGSGIFHPMPKAMTRPPDLSKKTEAGYELVAQRLAGSSTSDGDTDGVIRPAYRKFEALNHRVLLHLQDEISELEDELRLLDEWIAQSASVDSEGRIPPASRRTERRCGGEVHFRRTEILGKIFMKLQQYSMRLLRTGMVRSKADYRSQIKLCPPTAPCSRVSTRQTQTISASFGRG